MPTARPSWREVRWPPATDFNHDGFTDIAIGDPGATVDGTAGAGAVRLIYGHGVDPETFTQGTAVVGDTAEAGDGFGANVRLGDVDWDECVDLIVGVPAEDVGSAADAGTVHVIYGSPTGLGKGKAPSVWVQGADGFAGSVEAGDRFGAAISYGKGRAGYPRLLIGVPGEAVGSLKNAGMVHSRHFYADPSNGRTLLGNFGITQDSPGVDGTVEAGDRFGESISIIAPSWGPDLTDRLAIGVPGEDLGAATDARTGRDPHRRRPFRSEPRLTARDRSERRAPCRAPAARGTKHQVSTIRSCHATRPTRHHRR